jgi:tetratricopeptide (TPR) repeat protein
MYSYPKTPRIDFTADAVQRAWADFMAGRLDEAERRCQLALAVSKKNFHALHLQGLIHFQRRRFELARDTLLKALKLDSRSVDALINLAFALQALGQYEDALRYVENALKIQPSNVTGLNNRGNLLWLLKRYDEALQPLNKAIALQPKFLDALCNRSNALIALERYDDALKDLDLALSFNPRDPIVLNNRANVLWALDRRDDALGNFDLALAADPSDLSILKDRGSALLFAERESDALECFDRGLAIKPDDMYFLFKKGTALAKLNRFEDALACFDRTLEVDASNVDALNGRGNALASLTRAAEAIASYNKAIELEPETPEAHWNRSLTLLQVGNFKDGLTEYEWRWNTKSFTTKPRDFRKPLWLGNAPVAGKVVFIHAEQGFGDSIQFARYIPMVAALGAKVVVEVQAPLKILFSTIKGVAKVIAFGEELPAFDMHCPMLSLPLAFKTELETIPSGVPYLWADAVGIQNFREILPRSEKKLIGIAWAGRSSFGGDRSRSIGLEGIASLMHSEGCHFIGIQKDLRDGDQELMATLPNFTWVGDKLSDFSSTAALMSTLDLIISSDTSVVHLAGALARPAWILLEHKPDWRWLLERSDSPWYPTTRLFRQAKLGDWESVVTSAKDALHGLTG